MQRAEGKTQLFSQVNVQLPISCFVEEACCEACKHWNVVF